MPGWHTIIRGLAPQAGGFRRRPNKNSSVGLSAWLIVCLGRLPCALQVVACHLQSVSYLNTCQACNPGSEPVASHEQYITNKYAPGLHEYRAIFCYNCRGIPFDAKKELRICYKGVSELTKEHRAQLLNYLRLTKCKMGLLVNFASYPKATVEQWAL